MSESVPRADLLETIVAATRRSVVARQAVVPAVSLERGAALKRAARSFRQVLTNGATPRVIAECKRRSPSRGVLRRQYDPAAIASAYAKAGAAAISVLTEPTFFDGAIEHLTSVRTAVDIPVLRKDFIVTDYQLLEARCAGADAVLLIVAAFGYSSPGLRGPGLRDLIARARSLDLDVLVEVHDEFELERALDAGADIIGVNNRNLRTLDVTLDVTRRLAPRIPAGVVKVAESGLKTADDVAVLAGMGYDAFLVGERFMTAVDPAAALTELIGGAKTA